MIARYSTAHDAATVDYQLFQLDTDIGESDNVAGRYPEVVDAMRERLEDFYIGTSALVPTPNPNYGGTTFNSSEINLDHYLAAAGLERFIPESFLIADPDNDGRNNRQEFLQQTDPNIPDPAIATVWLNEGELRFMLPANTDQRAYSILDKTGAVAFITADLELDGQYGPFFVYKPTHSVPSPNPRDYTITVADSPVVLQSSAELTVDYRALLDGTQRSRTDTIQLGNNLLVDSGSGLGFVQDVAVTTTGVGGDFRPGGNNGLAMVGGMEDVWFDSGEKIRLDFTLQTTDGIIVTNLQLEIIDVGARAADGETMTLSNQSVLATASWDGGTGAKVYFHRETQCPDRSDKFGRAKNPVELHHVQDIRCKSEQHRLRR
jgi:hypothetical protein